MIVSACLLLSSYLFYLSELEFRCQNQFLRHSFPKVADVFCYLQVSHNQRDFLSASPNTCKRKNGVSFLGLICILTLPFYGLPTKALWVEIVLLQPSHMWLLLILAPIFHFDFNLRLQFWGYCFTVLRNFRNVGRNGLQKVGQQLLLLISINATIKKCKK